jgi:hypothetical protein
MKEAQMRQRNSSNTSTGFIVWEEALQREVSSQSQKPTAAYRLGVDIGRGPDGKFCWVGDFPRVELRIGRGSQRR